MSPAANEEPQILIGKSVNYAPQIIRCYSGLQGRTSTAFGVSRFKRPAKIDQRGQVHAAGLISESTYYLLTRVPTDPKTKNLSHCRHSVASSGLGIAAPSALPLQGEVEGLAKPL